MKSFQETFTGAGDVGSPIGGTAIQTPVRGRRSRQSVLQTAPVILGLPEAEAAVAIGVSQTKFRELVAAGTMPPARVVGGKLVYDVDELRLALKAIPHQGGDAEVDTWADVISEG
jgi:hypothetical protein